MEVGLEQVDEAVMDIIILNSTSLLANTIDSSIVENAFAPKQINLPFFQKNQIIVKNL